MAKVNVFIKKDYIDKLGDAPILVEYNHEGENWRFNTQLKANPTLFGCVFDPDIDLYKLTALTTLTPARKKRQLAHNAVLKSIQEKLSYIIEVYTTNKIAPLPALIERDYTREENTSTIKSKSVNDWYDEFIKCKEGTIGDGINAYRATWRHFKNFNSKNQIFFLQDITKAKLEQFKDYVKAQGIKGAGIHKQFKNLRVFLNWIETEFEEVEVPSCYKKINVKARYGKPIGLSVNQFLQLYNVDLSAFPELQRTRDLFVFGVSIGGTRHGDLKRMSESFRKHGYTVDQGVITYFERKTGNEHQEVLVNRFGQEILAKYSKFPYVPTNQRMNANLKSIANKLKWFEIKFLPRYNEYGKLVTVEEVPLKDILSTKFMRKTAATIDNYLGIPIKTSMSRTGHKTFDAYSRYVDINKESMEAANNKWDEMFEKASDSRPEGA
ncbi:MAG TPA: phage integrase SAM-like domain-containing protein [Ohtaekwangia sp.]|uniref:phage integrase SAM-like domain-containing protein n=1 Tax=Ohtaekwangia sp. TaxID=2066019 RepID=UPI002F922C1E